ncbi:predicted protein, partial [Scheffersomyces stipitis CBS 6054]
LQDGPSSQSSEPEVASISLREDLLFNSNRDVNRKSPDGDSYQEWIADALGFSNESKIPQGQKQNAERGKNHGSIEIAGPLLSTSTSKEVIQLLASSKLEQEAPRTRPATILTAKDILQAPGLRNDFYLNLVSWSKMTNKVLVGLGSHSYLWGVDNKVEEVNCISKETITAVSCSDSELAIIATYGGHIYLVDIEHNTLRSTYYNNGKCMFCFAWVPNSQMFLAGDEDGEVYSFEIDKNMFYALSLKNKVKCNSQQICGMAINCQGTEVAIGGNDNRCSLWQLLPTAEVHLRFILPHNAAIKAIAFCPWTSSLLATGGGSKDRKIRFWHTNSGTLLKEFSTSGQITSLVWSSFRKEITATFGFGSEKKSYLMQVYSYPSMATLVEVPATLNLRILSSTLSPDGTCLCVATNDSTIRIYKLWEKTHKLVKSPDSSGYGSYGSSLIDLQEGVVKRGETIR